MTNAHGSKFYRGPFGRLFPESELPAWSPRGVPADNLEEHFVGIAKEMVEAPGNASDIIAKDRQHSGVLDKRFDSSLPAGYTFFGQFIDHDMTFDPASLSMRRNDPDGLLNQRTPRLDLDSVYGSGHEVSPHLYQKFNRDMFLIGSVEGHPELPDLPRNQEGIALIADPRNDENAMLSQLHLAFLLAHNHLVVRAQRQKIHDAFDDPK